jgi:hypothetical protein
MVSAYNGMVIPDTCFWQSADYTGLAMWRPAT